jgi:hypothetical protein
MLCNLRVEAFSTLRHLIFRYLAVVACSLPVVEALVLVVAVARAAQAGEVVARAYHLTTLEAARLIPNLVAVLRLCGL